MTNCVTTTAYGRGLYRTPKVASARSAPGGVQVAAAPGLLRDEEAVGSNPATTTVIKICPLWSDHADQLSFVIE